MNPGSSALPNQGALGFLSPCWRFREGLTGEEPRKGLSNAGTAILMHDWWATRILDGLGINSTRAPEPPSLPAEESRSWTRPSWPWCMARQVADCREQFWLSSKMFRPESLRDWRYLRERASSPSAMMSIKGVVLCTSARLTFAPSSSILRMKKKVY